MTIAAGLTARPDGADGEPTMALEGINTAQYDAFVSFARANLAERGGKSVARLAEGGAARAISAADPGRDGVHKFWRGGDEKTMQV